jgi:hypothetical protein
MRTEIIIRATRTHNVLGETIFLALFPVWFQRKCGNIHGIFFFFFFAKQKNLISCPEALFGCLENITKDMNFKA